MKSPTFLVTGGPGHLPDELAAALPDGGSGFGAPGSAATILVNADPAPEPGTLVARCHAWADAVAPGEEALIVTIFPAPPAGLAGFGQDSANAALWSFTRRAALDWAARKIRVNAIGLGAPPLLPGEAAEQSGRAAASMPAACATTGDIVRTIRAMASFPSMTGQLVRLGPLSGPETSARPGG